MIDFSTFKASDYAAWWGAIVASLALIWNIVVAIRTGPKIIVTATPNMQLYPPAPGEEDKSFIFVKAVNTGTSPTTITHFHGYQAKGRFDYFRKKHKPFIVSNNGRFPPPPIKLGPGDEWVGIMDQDSEILSDELLYIGIIHNQNKKPVLKKVHRST